MKTELLEKWGPVVRLIPESEEEKYVLEKLSNEGVWVSGSGSPSGYIEICSAKYSGLTALLIDEQEKAVIAYALGETKQSLSDLPINLELLKAKLFRRPPATISPLPRAIVVEE